MKRLLSTMLATLLLLGSAQPVVLAADIPDNTSQAILNAEATIFNVLLPTILPVGVDSEHNITVANDVTLTNNSTGPIEVSGITIEPRNGWSKVNIPSDKVGTKEFNLQVSTSDPGIPAKASESIVYSALVSPQKTAISETIADVIFTVGWDNAIITSTELLETNPSQFGFIPGDTKELAFRFQNVASNEATFTSSNTAVATVREVQTKSGLLSGEKLVEVRAVSEGTVTITGKLSDGNESTIEVVVGKPLLDKDTHLEGNYKYTYSRNDGGWDTQVIDKSQTVYQPPLEIIRGKPVIRYTRLFSEYANTELVLGGIWSNTYVTDMFAMFELCKAKELDLSNFSTDNITNMRLMFYGNEIPKLDLSNFNTANVTDMAFLLGNSKTTEVDLSSFNTSKVTDMRMMLNNLPATTLDISNFNTGNVKDMGSMLGNTKATELDLSNFDTSKVTDMGGMFSGAQATTINVSGLDTSNVTNMGGMFSGAQATTLELSNFDTSKVTNMAGMFKGTKVTELDLSNFDTASVINTRSMFEGAKLSALDLSSFDTSSLKTTLDMFRYSMVTTGYARTQADADKFNSTGNKPATLTFIVKP